MLRCLLVCLLLGMSSCGKSTPAGGAERPSLERLGEPTALVGQATAKPSTTLSPWYGKAAHDSSAPAILSDQRQAWTGAAPLRLAWNLEASTQGPRQLNTAVRAESTKWEHAWTASVFWQEESGEVQLLWQESIAAQNEAAHSPSWKAAQVFLPESAGTLILGAQWENPGLATQSGLRVAWQRPEVFHANAARELPDIVLISIDTLRHDALAEMPQLQALMDEGWQWQEAYAPSNWTLPAMASLFTGLDVDAHGVGRGPFAPSATGKAENRAFRSLQQGPTIAEVLQTQGYATGMWHQNPFLEAWSGLDLGFERYVRCADRPLSAATDAFSWWEQQSSPRFLVLHEFTPHYPYAPDWQGIPDPLADLPTASWFGADLAPQERMSRFSLTPEQQEAVRTRYRHQLLALDQALASMMTKLRASSPECLILIHADHGEELWDAGRFEHGFGFDDSVTRVPLAIIWPGELEPAIAQGPAPAHHLLTLCLDLLQERRGFTGAEFPSSALRSASGKAPAGGQSPLHIGAPLYRSLVGGRHWSAAEGWKDLPFDGKGSQGLEAQLPVGTAQQLVELGYTGEVSD